MVDCWHIFVGGGWVLHHTYCNDALDHNAARVAVINVCTVDVLLW